LEKAELFLASHFSFVPFHSAAFVDLTSWPLLLFPSDPHGIEFFIDSLYVFGTKSLVSRPGFVLNSMWLELFFPPLFAPLFSPSLFSSESF